MSKQREPRYKLHYLRAEFPEEWRYIQRQIDEILDHPPSALAFALRDLDREAARAAIEDCLDTGVLRFRHVPGSREYFAVLVYDPDHERYLVFAEDGTIRRIEDTCWKLPEADDE